ncbi:ABC transporter ATP-binding protein [Salinisphaera sp. LB1]|uniref:ABC transporter ATP-binding protein n=1 Tax=Salinisphaera sp. LB1 TaxID=2183911 RepID=UPI000D7089C6|nr:ABC transporter ATP-binding protein [Salinisphaera sp. LB1]AWN15207.1 Oligopeptide transport system permease protein OppB [Salinisphaera sp. LB1]
MLLEVQNLKIDFKTHDGTIDAVHDLSFSIERGEAVGIVGESGSGKSQSVLALMGLLAGNARVTGSARLAPGSKGGAPVELLGAKPRVLRRVRGARIAMIFQDPMTALNPHLKISTQMIELLRAHRGMGKRAAMRAAIDMLEAVRIPEAARRIKYYPHQFSGGMRQRVMIAMALSCEPELLIADEPTTALDVTVQDEILELIAELRERSNTALLLITHDLGVVAGQCSRALVMRGGDLVEHGSIEKVFNAPEAQYTRDLLAAIPRLEG